MELLGENYQMTKDWKKVIRKEFSNEMNLLNRVSQVDLIDFIEKELAKQRTQLLKEVRDNLYKLRPKTIDPDALPESDSKPEEAYELGYSDGVYLFEGNILKKLGELEHE